MKADVDVEKHTAEALATLEAAQRRALEVVGGMWESNAKALCVIVGRDGGTARLSAELRNSITHQVQGDEVAVGSGMQVAPYIELGTGPNYEPPPEYMEFDAKPGRGQAGITSWIYFDELEHEFRIGTPQPARPFLRPAYEEHREEYNRIIEAELGRDGE